MIQRIEIAPGVVLRCCPQTKFKQGCLSLSLIRPTDAREAAMNALLPAVLLRGTRDYPDLQAITRRLDTLYGASAGSQVRRIGDYQTVGFYCSFIEDAYALPGDRVLAPMVDFLRQVLLCPVLENGVLSASFVEGEKRNLIQAIEAQRNDKRAYAGHRLFEIMCREDSFGVFRLGQKAAVAAITPKMLTDHYHRLLAESPVELFYVGSAQPEQLAQLLRPLFDSRQPRKALPAQTPFHPCLPSREEETLDVTQGRLCMGFYTPVTSRTEGFAAMQLFNAVFGSGMISKLFMVIREQMSLCYDIGSSYHGSKGILTVSAGVDFCQLEAVEREVCHQLELCRNGQITDEELEAARQYLYSGLRAVSDSPGALENFYASGALTGSGMTAQENMQALARVDKAQVAQAARQVRLHTVYFLKGDAEDAQ